MAEHSQRCFDVQTQRCVCGIENRSVRARDAADDMLSLVRELEWSGVAHANGQVHRAACPICGGKHPESMKMLFTATALGHCGGCRLAALLARVDGKS